MNSFVVYEALTVGCKEGLKLGILWLVLSSYLSSNRVSRLLRPFAAGVAVSFLAAFALFFIVLEPLQKEVLGNAAAMSFALFLIASAGALLDASGVRLFLPFRRFAAGEVSVFVIIFSATLLFFLPDCGGSAVFLKDLSFLNERLVPTYASALAGFMAALGGCALLGRALNRRVIASLFELPQLLIFFSMMKLMTGGTQGFAELSMIPSVQRGLMKFSHDIIHQIFVLLMVPDHPLLKTTTWNFIGFFFGPNIALWESLFVILLFPLMFIYHSLFMPQPRPEAYSGAERRKLLYGILSDKRRKALPVLVFVCLIIAFWFSQGKEEVSSLYLPAPKPVVEDRGLVLIPLTDPTMNLRDGRLHKFSLAHKGQDIRMIVIRKPEGDLSVCLDACEICPPDGYGQRAEHVVCVFCNTPVPAGSLGKPGGCNPIPLLFTFDDRFVRIDMAEILKKVVYINSGKSNMVEP